MFCEADWMALVCVIVGTVLIDISENKSKPNATNWFLRLNLAYNLLSITSSELYICL